MVQLVVNWNFINGLGQRLHDSWGSNQGGVGCKTWWHGAFNIMTLSYLRFQDVITQVKIHISKTKTLGYRRGQTRCLRLKKWWYGTDDIMTSCHDKVGALNIVAWCPKHGCHGVGTRWPQDIGASMW